MPELRHDPLQRRWVIIAVERARRPMDFTLERDPAAADNCPFCYGNEARTPPEIIAYRDVPSSDAPGWKVRVVSNKFPALRIEGELERAAVGQYDRMNGIGATVVENVDLRVGDQLFPVRAVGFIPVTRGLSFHNLGLLIAEHRQARRELCFRIDVWDLFVGVGVALAHETAPEQADAKFLFRADRDLVDRHEISPIY